MKARELISKLQALVEEHGDLEVYLWPSNQDHTDYICGVRTGPLMRPNEPRTTLIIEGGDEIMRNIRNKEARVIVKPITRRFKEGE